MDGALPVCMRSDGDIPELHVRVWARAQLKRRKEIKMSAIIVIKLLIRLEGLLLIVIK